MRALLLLVPACALLGSCAGGHAAHEDEHADEHGHEDEHGGRASSVTLTESALARADVRVDEAASGPFAGAIEIPAEVELDPDRVVHVASLVSGRVEEVRVTVGQRVSEGEVLAVLRSAALGDARAALAEARAELAVAEAAHARQRELADAGIGARRALVEAEGALRTARARVAGLRDRTGVYGRGGAGAVTYLRSSIAGQVVERHATVGEVAAADATLFVVADASVVWIAGRAYPEDGGALAPARPRSSRCAACRSAPGRERSPGWRPSSTRTRGRCRCAWCSRTTRTARSAPASSGPCAWRGPARRPPSPWPPTRCSASTSGPSSSFPAPPRRARARPRSTCAR
ncbi:MAG: efflux RND transporter periplasmic adaptor subunit [Sandaracinaceae bacterium]|nr:efflux RND transporter periplasmic adaptor subunit [Sandaracinaceae bacterium]